MKAMIFASTAAAALMLAGAASAQVAGGLTGQIGGSVGVQTPPVGQVTQGVGQAARDAGQMTRDSLRDTRDAARDTQVGVDANAQVSTEAQANRDGAASDTAIQAGVMVHGSDGAMLGTVADVTRDTAGRATAFTLRTADGATRTVSAADVSLQGEALVMGSAGAEPTPR